MEQERLRIEQARMRLRNAALTLERLKRCKRIGVAARKAAIAKYWEDVYQDKLLARRHLPRPFIKGSRRG
jgi:hypothetical protein